MSLRHVTRAAAALLIAALPLGLTACSDTTNSADGKPTISTTFTILQDITENIAGDTATVTSLTKPGDEIHGFEPTPATIKEAAHADMIITNGLGLENWAEQLYKSSKATRVTASDGVTPIPIDGSDLPNPHAWMSPTVAQKYVSNIEKALAEKYPEHAETYHRNAQTYRDKIQKVRDDVADELATIPNATLVTCEGAFSYLAKDFHLKEGYIWPVNADGEITASQINGAVETVKRNKVPATFCESTVNTGPQHQVLAATGASDGGTLFVDSLTDSSGPAPTYLDLLTHDTTTIVNGLKKK
ncbi:metal ABC transporter substrate-binding protein [Corynebacterium sp. 320]|uniref:metal ABC transporter solute-binding protein, Zn/Mn family n=1 Tax=Corynebacterium TaxID=1716 RepID=UPI00125CBCD8|nr:MULTISPECIES: zinc ABC transporter substrate-binding protein [Corynebacterium]KAB1504047.1 metal ABC transporter substrate-binding protein [Corynebacterium sp. 320]KAB1552854.1 metal ABC transporter substrate-binding protein [Corynebacterium sp. 321]KAB1553928.1 metal ABC transporter substrate-binding protein [Corynebacterium sp. 319]KAB3528183.1 metal ABC transporter substrate-binding protein [Corynebacterium sp. 250]KAB3540329.1 metal ABC transporter substrate-binding protein [Corynebacte